MQFLNQKSDNLKWTPCEIPFLKMYTFIYFTLYGKNNVNQKLPN